MNFSTLKAQVTNFPFFGKKKNKTELVIKSVAVIFNLANHSSLIAAALYVLARRAIEPEVSVILVDIRDRLPMDVDQYVWVDAGGPEVFRDYCKQNATAITDPSATKVWCRTLEDKSVVFTTEEDSKGLLMNMSVGQGLAHLGGTDIVGDSLTSLFIKYGILGYEFSLNNIEVHRYCIYYAALEIAYSVYLGHDVGLNDFTRTLELPEEICDGFDASQKRASKAMVYKSRETTIDDHTVQYITALGPDVFNIIRRIKLAKKPFVHMTTGSYGQVVYSDIKFSEKVEFEKAVFLLTPQIEKTSACELEMVN